MKKFLDIIVDFWYYTNMQINEEFFESIINSFETFDITEDKVDNIEDKRFIEALEKEVNSIISLGEENSILLYKEKIDKEIPIIGIDRDIVASSLFFSLFISMYDYVLRKYYKENQYNYVISNLLKHSIKVYKDILSFILTKSPDGILSRIRTIYETWIIQEFIIRNKQLAVVFREHKRIIALKLNEGMGKKSTKKTDKIISDLLNKYGDDFAQEFGWTASVIKNIKKRNPQGLANYLNLGTINSYNYIYKIACQFVHTTSFGIFSEEESKIEMIDLFNINAVEIIFNMFIKFMDELKVNYKEKEILLSLLIGVIDEVKKM